MEGGRELTARQREVLDFVRHYASERGMPPTRSEIARALGFRSANAADQHLRALARKSALRLIPGASRGICLGMPGEAAGRGDAAAMLDWLQGQSGSTVCYQGAPLRSLGILPGDWLVLAEAGEPVHDQLVLVNLAGQRSVKRFRRKGTRAYLVSDAADSAAFVVSLRDRDAIEAVVLGVVRRYGPTADG